MPYKKKSTIRFSNKNFEQIMSGYKQYLDICNRRAVLAVTLEEWLTGMTKL